MFIESREEQSHNQVAALKRSITENRKKHFKGDDAQKELIHYDSPLFFDMGEVIDAIRDKNEERVPGAKGGDRAGQCRYLWHAHQGIVTMSAAAAALQYVPGRVGQDGRELQR